MAFKSNIARVLDQLTIAASCRRLGQYVQAREHIALARELVRAS